MSEKESAASESNSAATESNAAAEESNPAVKKTILAIDDDITILTSIRKIVEKDYDVSLAKSAEIAWNILNNTLIDMILLDIEMPNISGLAFIDYLKQNRAFQYIPVIFVTSQVDQDSILKAKRSGAKGFIAKPLSASVLLEKIRSVFTETEYKSEKEILLKKLHLLEVACRTGKSADMEKLTGDLLKKHYNVGTDGKLIEICRSAAKCDYTQALEGIANLIKNNLFDIK